MHAEADGVVSSFRHQPLRVMIDTPPKFEKAAGFTAQSRPVRPGEQLPIECRVVDDYGVVQVNLEVRVNDKLAKTIPLPLKGIGTPQAGGSYALDLSGLAKEGDRVDYRLAATDNRNYLGCATDAANNLLPRRWEMGRTTPEQGCHSAKGAGDRRSEKGNRRTLERHFGIVEKGKNDGQSPESRQR